MEYSTLCANMKGDGGAEMCSYIIQGGLTVLKAYDLLGDLAS